MAEEKKVEPWVPGTIDGRGLSDLPKLPDGFYEPDHIENDYEERYGQDLEDGDNGGAPAGLWGDPCRPLGGWPPEDHEVFLPDQRVRTLVDLSASIKKGMCGRVVSEATGSKVGRQHIFREPHSYWVRFEWLQGGELFEAQRSLVRKEHLEAMENDEEEW